MMQQPTFIQSPLGDYQNIHNIRKVVIEDNAGEGHAVVLHPFDGEAFTYASLPTLELAEDKADELLYEGGAKVIPNALG